MSIRRGIIVGLLLIMIGGTAVMTLADSISASEASTCDPAQMADHARYPSPDERYTATDSAIIDVQANRCEIIANITSPEFFGWSGDGRYAVFNAGDQYGSTWGAVFDTQKWLPVPVAFRDADPDCSRMSGACRFAARAIAPILKRVLFEDGTLLYLADSQQYTLLGDAPDHLIAAAAFSPGEQYIAYVRYRFTDASQAGTEYAVYAANGDGTDPRLLLALDAYSGDPIGIEWDTHGNPKFTLTIGATQTVINVWTGEINP